MRSKPAQHFDAHAWARASLRDAPKLQPDTLATVAGFTFIWNLFEGVACNGSASVPALDRVAGEIERSPALPLREVEQSIAFYRFRYIKENELQQRFYGLNFRAPDRQELVEAVLKGENTSLHATLLALLIIAYRIRNNLFHGLKSVHIWDDQAEQNRVTH
jgi:hypothetical protein